jgi:PAS domain S-box-containing protein
MWTGRHNHGRSACWPVDEQTTNPWLETVSVDIPVLYTRERQQAAVRQFGLFTLSTNNLDTLMRKAVAVVVETLNVEYGKVLELLPGGKEFRLRWGTGWQEGAVGHARVGAGTDSQGGYTLMSHVALLSKGPVIVTDLLSETRFRSSPLLRTHGVTSGLSVVIEGPSKPFGVLGAHTATRRRFTQRDADFVQAIADILAAAMARLEIERISRNNNVHLQLLVEQVPAVHWTTDAELRVISAQGAALSTLNLQPDRLVGTHVLEFFQSVPASATAHAHRRAIAGHSSNYQLTFGERIFQAYVEPLRNTAGTIMGCIGIAFDITERAQAEKQLEQLFFELRDAQATMRILHGLLPICASCKQIRDGGGSWEQIEKYICDHADVRFSHGVCPDCFQRLYPDIPPVPSNDGVKSA